MAKVITPAIQLDPASLRMSRVKWEAAEGESKGNVRAYMPFTVKLGGLTVQGNVRGIKAAQLTNEQREIALRNWDTAEAKKAGAGKTTQAKPTLLFGE